MRIRGEGEAGDHGGPDGDLFVVMHVKEHSFFSREGDNLFCELPISFIQAALGDSIKIPVLGEEKLHEIKIPQGTQPGDVISVPEMGMPGVSTKRRGQLFIKFIVRIPKKLNRRQRELLEEFMAAEGIKTTEKIGRLFRAK